MHLRNENQHMRVSSIGSADAKNICSLDDLNVHHTDVQSIYSRVQNSAFFIKLSLKITSDRLYKESNNDTHLYR